MDLSINNVNSIEQQPSFKGIKGDLDAQNRQVFRFSTSSHKTSEAPYLELTLLEKDVNKNGKVDTNLYYPLKTMRIPFKDKNTLEIPQELFEKEGIEAFAYKYIYKDENGEERSAIDAFKTITIGDEKKNLIEIGNNYGVTPTGGAMYHAFIDSVGYDPSKMTDEDKEFIRTHANKLGGSIGGLTYLLKKGYYDAYKYIISTPDIGADLTSPHRYWPNNQYQCSNMDDFKDFNFELFKRGKGYVADGAFTSQSLQSPLVQHAIKWGEQSPFFHMLKVDDKIQLGVLPQNAQAINHVRINLINSPKSDEYDPKKPTLMQFVDDRLLSDEQKRNTKKLIEKYGITNPSDHYDSVGYQDTIHPFYFEIKDNDFDKKIPLFEDKNYVMLKDLKPQQQRELFGFEGADIVQRYSASGATFWDGNVDIIKMNLSNPNINSIEDYQGFINARKYLYGVATFWTEAIQSDLLKRTAQMNAAQIAEIAKNGGLTSKEFDAVKENVKNDKNGSSFNSLLYKYEKDKNGNIKFIPFKTAKDYVSEFPLQSIETSPELSAIFSQPQFNQELLKGETRKKVIEQLETSINNVIPSKYKNNKEYETYVTKAYANEILKTMYAQSILDGSVDYKGNIDIDKLRDRATLKSMLEDNPTTAENERHQVVSRIAKNLKTVNNTAIEAKIAKELKDVSLQDFKLAEAVVSQTKGGLNWRFDAARDIGDLSIVKDGLVTFQDIWNGTGQAEGVQQFWSEFVSRIKTYNPGSYIVAEITNFGEFLNWNNYESMMDYDSNLANTYMAKLKADIDKAEPNSPLSALANTFADTSKSDEARKIAFSKAIEALDKKVYGDKFEKLKAYKKEFPNVNMNTFESIMDSDKNEATAFLTKLSNEIQNLEPNTKIAYNAKRFANPKEPYLRRKIAYEDTIKALNNKRYGDKFETFRDYENNLPYQKEQNFLEQIGATTGSNYSTYFNKISHFVGSDPEHGKPSIKDDFTGRLDYLKENTDRFLAHVQPNGGLLSHTFVDNHDKPRVLHTMPLDMELVVTGLNLGTQGRKYKSLEDLGNIEIKPKDDFKTKTEKFKQNQEGKIKKEKIKKLTGRDDLKNVNAMAAAVGLMMSDKIDEADFSKDEKAKLHDSLRKLVNGETPDGEYDARRARAFGFLPYEITIKDLFKDAGIDDEKKIEAFNKIVMDEPMFLEDKLWQLLNALVGVPTVYYGTEYAQTGYETYSKNDLVGNRNRALHERKENSLFTKFYDKMNATAALQINPKLTALRNGFPESLEIQEVDEEFEMYPIYRKDERNSQVISVITNFGISHGTLSPDQGHKFEDKLKPKEVSGIKLQDSDKRCPLENGVTLKRMVYSEKDKKYVTEKQGKNDVIYKIKNGEIVKNDGSKIQINDTVATFYVDKTNVSRFAPAYNGAH